MERAGSWNGPEPHSEHFPVAFAGCQFLQQGIRVKTKKLHQALVGCGIVYVLAIFLREEVARPLVEHMRCQNHVVAQTDAKAPRRTLSQINKVMLRFHSFHSSTVSKTLKTLDKVKLNTRQRSADLLHCAARSY